MGKAAKGKIFDAAFVAFVAAILATIAVIVVAAQAEARDYRYEKETVEAVVVKADWTEFYRPFYGWRVNADVSVRDTKYGCEASRMWRNCPVNAMSEVVNLSEGDTFEVSVHTRYSKETGEVVGRKVVF